jgi:thiosulfate dehydrogenase (quinone) large subunit
MSATRSIPAAPPRPASSAERTLPSPSTGWTGTAVRLIFGVIWGLDAALKWLPGYRHHYISQLQEAAEGQPSWLHGWFHFWITLQKGAPALFADLTGVMETALAVVLLLGVARRLGYTVGLIYSLLVWAVGEGFGGPYESGSTDVGTGIVYALLFATLLVFAPPARRDRLSLDRILAGRVRWWRHVAEPHAVDRVHGAPLVEPVVVGRTSIDEGDGANAENDGGWARPGAS